MGAAVITGAGRGLGLEIARALAARGLAVNVTDVDASAAEAAAASIGPNAWGSALDVRDADACSRVATAAAERAGALDVWVNNAGVLVTGHVWEHDVELRRTLSEERRRSSGSWSHTWPMTSTPALLTQTSSPPARSAAAAAARAGLGVAHVERRAPGGGADRRGPGLAARRRRR